MMLAPPLFYEPSSAPVLDLDLDAALAALLARAGPVPAHEDRPRCRACHHPVRVDLSLALRIGPKCRRKYGITTSSSRVRHRAARIPRANPSMPGQDPLPDPDLERMCP